VKVSPLDIRRKEFKRSVRGYLEEDVDIFLDSVADEVERLSQENAEMGERLKVLEEQVAGHAHIREALEKTLVAAELQSEEIRSKAQKESQSIVHEAETQARAVVDDLYAQTRKVQQTLMQLKLLEEDFRFKFRALLEGYLKLVDEGPILASTLQGDLLAAGAEVDDSPTSETTEAGSLTWELEKDSSGGAAGGAKKGSGSKKTEEKARSSVQKPTVVEGDMFPEGGGSSAARDFDW